MAYLMVLHLRSEMMEEHGAGVNMTNHDEMGEAEQRLADAGIVLEEEDFGREDEPNVGGCILAEYVEGGVRLKAVIRPGLSGDFRDMFADWAATRFARFIEDGPEPDGWQKRTSDDAWQLWARLHRMPDPGQGL
jgi:hypothetical protein